MALQLDGFSTPQQSYEGLYRIADDLRQDRRYQEQRDHQRAQMEQQRKLQTGKFLSDLGDPKDFLSGSPLDPEFVRRLGTIVQKGQGMAAEGADYSTLQMGLAKEVNELLQYAQTAKVANEQLGESLKLIAPIKGIDKQKFADEFKARVFYDIDPQTGQRKLKDPSKIDVSQNYADEILRTGDVYSKEGVSEWVKGLQPETFIGDYTYYDSKGRKVRSQGEYSAPSIMVAEKDTDGVHKGFVPDYEKITDEGNPIVHKWDTKDGVKDGHIRMIKQTVFDAMPKDVQAYYIQEARKFARENGIPVADARAEYFARAVAYGDIAESGRYKSRVKEYKETKPTSFELNVRAGKPVSDGRDNGGEIGTGGNAFDDFANAEYKSFSVKDGAFYNKDGTPKTGRVFVTGAVLPASIKSALKAGGIDPKFFISGVDAEVRDGQIVSISNKLIGTITREAMQGVYQPKMDTERKGSSLNFARGQKPSGSAPSQPKFNNLPPKGKF